MARTPAEQFEKNRSKTLRKKRLSETLNPMYEYDKNLYLNSEFFISEPRKGFYENGSYNRYSKGLVKCQCPICKKGKTNSKRSWVGKPRNYSISDQRKMDSMKDMGLLEKPHYGVIRLTDLGRSTVDRYQVYFQTICRHFTQFLPQRQDVLAAAFALLSELKLESVVEMCTRIADADAALCSGVEPQVCAGQTRSRRAIVRGLGAEPNQRLSFKMLVS